MANEIRRLYNFLGGEVQENPLAAAATSMTNPAFVAFPAVGSTEHVPITFDPDGIEGAPFVKWITAHTAASDTITMTAAGQEGTTERQVSQGIPFAHAATVRDLEKPSVSLRATSPQSIGNVTWTSINFQSEANPAFDPWGLHGSPDTRITLDRVGPWLVGGQFTFAASGTTIRFGRIYLNGTTGIAAQESVPTGSGNTTYFNMLIPVLCTAVGDYVELQAYQQTGSPLALIQGGETPNFWAVKL